MDYINNITLQGIAGNVKTNSYDGTKMVRMSVLTCSTYHSKDGMAVVDNQWHNVCAWENGDTIQNIDLIQKGSKVKVVGKLVYHSYTGSDGVERVSAEIHAKELTILHK